MPQNKFVFTQNLDPARQECFVFLPGWGFDGRIIELAPFRRHWLIPSGQLDPLTTIGDLSDFLNSHGIESIVLVGWSMGANLAVDFALRRPESVKALYLLGMRQEWPSGEIEEIGADLAANPIEFMKGFYRKCFLGNRYDYRKFTRTLEAKILNGLDMDRLEKGLNYLKNFNFSDKYERLARLNIPTYILHGVKDIIAPPAEMVSIPNAVSQVIRGAGHPVFLDQNCPLEWHHKKETIRLKFSRSAATYDEHALLQKKTAEELAGQLPDINPETILETGCGTGAYTLFLKRRYPEAQITALDFADKMLARAREKFAATEKVEFLCRDAEIFLRDTTDRFDLVTSNATMHWFDNLENSARLIRKRLTDRGALVFSIFGPETMAEMRQGLSEIHGEEVVMPSSFFPTENELQRIFSGLFDRMGVTERTIIRSYPDLKELLNNISRTGTAGWHPGGHLLNRRQMKDLERWFIETYGSCRISYQIFMVNCRK